MPFCKKLRTLSSVVLQALLAVNLFADAHPPAPPPPPGARTRDCTGRAIPELVDITAKTGIKFVHDTAKEKRYIVESMSGGLMVIDYDRDGWQDLYFTNAPTVEQSLKGAVSRSELYRNNGDGTFTDVTDKAGVATPCFAMGGAVADYNNDGWPDMYVTCLGDNVLYHNNGDGTFTNVAKKAGVTRYSWSAGAAFGDYDLDGFVDLMVTGYVDFRLDDLPGFGKAPTCKYRGVDVQCGPRGLKGASDTLYRNNGDGTFTDVTQKAGVGDPEGFYGLGVVFADFDNTGKPDIYVANDSTPNFLYRNKGDGTFEDIGLESGTGVSADGSEQGSMGVAIGDYNHKGRPSLFITNFADEYNTLYRNDGKYDFRDVSYDTGVALASLPWVKWGDAFFDLDNDGWLDVILGSGQVYPQVDELPSGARYKQPKNLYINEANGNFCNASTLAGKALPVPNVTRGVVVVDLENDGNLDIVIEDLDAAPIVLRNAGNPEGHWVRFELQGTKSNRLAIGAKVFLTAAGMTQSAEIHSGTSYLSQSDLRLHFGLGKAAKSIDSVEIRWPSGKVETLTNLEIDKSYAVLEGSGIVPFEKIRPEKLATEAKKSGLPVKK